METIRIPLGKSGNADGWAVIDFEDYERVAIWKWYSKDGYAFTSIGPSGRKKTTYLHNYLLRREPGDKDGMVVDHIDRDPLNNRKKNLRVVSQGENNRNSSRSDKALRQKIGHLVRSLHEQGVDSEAIAKAFTITEMQVESIISNDPIPINGWNKETMIQALQDFYARNHRVPKCSDCNGMNGMPPTSYIYRFFESIENARVEAGLRRDY